MARLVQTLITRNGQVLLGRWKSGPFASRISGCLGEILPNENLEAAAVRITETLTGLKLDSQLLKKYGLFTFYELETENSVSGVQNEKIIDEYQEYQLCYNMDFLTKPKQIEKETEQFCPQWYNLNEIPYKEMPEDDVFWYPAVLYLDRKLIGEFTFAGTKLVKHQLQQVDSI